MAKKYFKNHRAVLNAVREMIRFKNLAIDEQKKMGKNLNIQYDDRNLMSLALLTIDISSVSEAEQENYFLTEY